MSRKVFFRVVPLVLAAVLAVFHFSSTTALVPSMLTTVELLSATPDGEAGLVTSTKIDLEFDVDVDELLITDIALTTVSGSALVADVTGAGKSWTIALSEVIKEGEVSLAISKDGFEFLGTPKLITVFKMGDATVIAVSPENVTVSRGDNVTFFATVSGPDNPTQEVYWEVDGGVLDTVITSSGALSVSFNETAPILLVRARSAQYPTKYGVAIVNVNQPLVTPFTTPSSLQYESNYSSTTTTVTSTPVPTSTPKPTSSLKPEIRFGKMFLTVNVTDGVITSALVEPAIKSVTEVAAKSGKQAWIELYLADAGSSNASVSIEKAVVKELFEKLDGIVVKSPIASVSLAKKTLSELMGNISKVLSIDMAIAAASSAVPNAPVYDFEIKADGKPLKNFGNSTATVTIPYALNGSQNPMNVVMYYINASGKAEIIKNCDYNLSSKTVSFVTNHFSNYAIGYNQLSFKDFSDSDWYADAVNYVTARELFTGIDNGNFGAANNMTRAMFIAVMARLDGSSLARYGESPYADVDIYSWYGPSISWAKDKGLIKSSSTFSPNENITREDMALILSNYIKYKGLDLAVVSEQSFADIEKVSPEARDAVNDMKRYGLIVGYNNRYDPSLTADRAAVVTIFRNVIRAIVK